MYIHDHAGTTCSTTGITHPSTSDPTNPDNTDEWEYDETVTKTTSATFPPASNHPPTIMINDDTVAMTTQSFFSTGDHTNTVSITEFPSNSGYVENNSPVNFMRCFMTGVNLIVLLVILFILIVRRNRRKYLKAPRQKEIDITETHSRRQKHKPQYIHTNLRSCILYVLTC